MQEISRLLGNKKFVISDKNKKAHRDAVIEDIATLTGMKKVVIHWKTTRPMRIPTEWLEDWYRVSLQEFTDVGKRVKFWKLLNEYKKSIGEIISKK